MRRFRNVAVAAAFVLRYFAVIVFVPPVSVTRDTAILATVTPAERPTRAALASAAAAPFAECDMNDCSVPVLLFIAAFTRTTYMPVPSVRVGPVVAKYVYAVLVVVSSVVTSARLAVYPVNPKICEIGISRFETSIALTM